MPFPETIRALPRTTLSGADVYVHDDGRTQVLFVEAPSDRGPVAIPTHVHGPEWGFVVEGHIEMTIDGKTTRHPSGSTHLIRDQVPHSFVFAPGTCSVHFFSERRIAIRASRRSNTTD